MVYFKVVKPCTVWAEKKGWRDHYSPVIELVRNELYTSGELKRLSIPDRCVQRVEIPKSRTCWSFGSRFAMDDVLEGNT